MPGSPKKRARKKARELAERQQGGALPEPVGDEPARPGPAGDKTMGKRVEAPQLMPAEPPAVDGSPRAASPEAPSAPLQGEVLPPAPIGDAEPTRTTLRRAFRRQAEQYAEEALKRLVTGMRNSDDRIGVPAAREILDRVHGRPTPEIDAGEPGGFQVVILKFGDQT